MKKKTFGSISSGNNVFDLEHILRRTMKDMEVTSCAYVQKAREYFKQQMPYLNEMELANILIDFLQSEMTIKRFSQSMDILGCEVDITVKIPVKKLKVMEDETDERPPQFVFWDKSIDEMELAAHITNILKANEVLTFGHLVQLTEDQLMKFPNLGRYRLEQVKAMMRVLDMEFGTDVQGWRPAGEFAFKLRRIEDLHLPDKVNTILKNVGVFRVGQLCDLDERKLAAIAGLTVRDHSLIVLALREQKLKLAPSFDADGKEMKMASPFDCQFNQVLNIDVATYNALRAIGCEVLGQVVVLKEEDIRKLDGIGSTRFHRLLQDLKFMRLSLGMKLE